jgi:hypothetical protein
MSATTEVEICNLALTRLGHSMISSLAENTKAGNLCNLHYARTRNAVLRAHPWNFAIRRATLALDATAPNHEFTQRHALPVDCLKVLRTNWEADGTVGAAVYGYPGIMGYAHEITPYRIEGRYLLCNEDTVKIEYIAEITDVAQYDELFVDALAQRLGAELAVALTDNQSAAKTMWDIYSAKLAEARTTDAQEGTPRAIVDVSPWISARF